MPLFIIETTAESPIREFWQVEAATAREARDKFENGETGAFLWDEVTGDETEREISLVHGPDDLAGTVAIHRAQQTAPAMLAALQQAVRWIDAGCDPSAKAVDAMRAAIAAATATPTGEAAPPVDSDGKRTDTWNLVPGAQPEEDDAALSTYRITETAVYLVKAEDEAHAERRFVCEVGIHAESFHAVEGRTIELAEEGED